MRARTGLADLPCEVTRGALLIDEGVFRWHHAPAVRVAPSGKADLVSVVDDGCPGQREDGGQREALLSIDDRIVRLRW